MKVPIRAFSLPLLVALVSTQSMSAQVETFDIATFVRPRGWSRAESDGIVVLQDRKVLAGQVTFCQIYLFPSRPSNANPSANFQMEWEAKIRQPLGITARPSPETETTPEGWTVLTARADVVRLGLPMRTILVTVTGFGKFISVMVTVSPNSYQAEILDFFKNLDFNADLAGQNPPRQSSQPATPGASGGLEPR